MDAVRVADLSFSYGDHPVLRSLSLTVGAAEIVGLLGASGSGKSTLGRALLQTDEARRMFAYIPQEPYLALNPFLRVRTHVTEVLRARRLPPDPEEALIAAELADRRVWRSYPHQLSGGQRQRVLIAQAICRKASLIIADEPTAALDEGNQQAMLNLFQKLRRQFNTAILFITHNPLLLDGFADRVLVLAGGRIVEQGTPEDILQRPQHPYSRQLKESLAFA